MKRIDLKSVIIGLLSGVCIMLMMGQAKEEKPKADMSNVYDIIKTKDLQIMNDEGVRVGRFSSTFVDGGHFDVCDSKGKTVMSAMAIESASVPAHGGIFLKCNEKYQLVMAARDDEDRGAYINLYNKTGEDVVQLSADAYGNGVVGAFDRKGKGRTLEPGP